MANELYVSDCWIYFRTQKATAEDALEELFEACNKAGIELYVIKRVLRDENGNDIDD